VELDFDPLLLASAVLSVWVAYGLLIDGWRRLIVGWGQNVEYRSAVKIWCVSNLGRYLPGKVWSVAGLAVLAKRAGASGGAATGSALTMQALAIATGACVVAVAAPAAISLPQLGLTLVFALTVIWTLATSGLTARIVRWVRPALEWRPLSARASLLAAAANLIAWVVYGVAFWLLAKGILPQSNLSIRGAVGVFAAGYVVGFLALFAPGGIGVREAVFVALLAPRLGSGEAVALAVGSRLLLTLTEVGAALTALVIDVRTKEQTIDPTR